MASDTNKIQVIFEAVMTNFKGGINDAIKGVDKLGESGKDADKNLSFKNSADGLDNLNNKLDNVSKKFKQLVVAYAGKKLFDFGVDVEDRYEEYEQSIRKIFTLLPEKSAEARQLVSDDLRELSKELRRMPQEVTQASYDAISASVAPENLYDFLRTANMTAVGGATSLGTSTDVLTSVVNAYTEEVISYTQASDMMFEAMKLGKVTIDSIASSLYSFLPVAKAINSPFEDSMGALATMTATGTPNAQASTQLGRLYQEFSKDTTMGSKYLKQATGKSFKELMDEGYNLQQVLMIMEQVSKKLGIEMNALFANAQAGKAALNLTGTNAERFTRDLEEITNASGSTKDAFDEMFGSLAYKRQALVNFKEDFLLMIGEVSSAKVGNSMDSLLDSLERAEASGALERLAESIGNIIAVVVDQFTKIIDNADVIIEKMDNVANFIETRLPGAIEVVKSLAKAWLTLKAITKVVGWVMRLIEVFALLGEVSTIVGGALTAAGVTIGAIAAPALVVIGVIGLLIFTIYKLSQYLGGFTNFLKVMIDTWIIMVGSFIKFWVGGVDAMLRAGAALTSNIPLIGDAFEAMADKSSRALAFLDGAVANSIGNIRSLQEEIANGYSGDDLGLDAITGAGIPGDGKGKDKNKSWIELLGFNPDDYKYDPKDVKIPDFSLDKVERLGKDADKTKKKKPKTIQDRIREVEEKTSPQIDLYTSRADLAKAREQEKEWESNKRSEIDSLKQQERDLLKLESSSKGADKQIVETARNKVLLKIESILKEINEGIKELIGSFNLPSELKIMTEYQYELSKAATTTLKRLVYAPNVEMYLTVEDLKGKSIRELQQEVANVTNALFSDKNDLVDKILDDVTRH